MSLIPPSPPLDEPRSTKYMRTLSASSRSASADTLRHDARSLRVSQPPALRTPPTSNLRGGMGQEYIDIGKGGLGTRRPTDVTSNFFKRSGPDSSLESERLMSSIPPPHPKILSALPNRSKGTGGDSMSLVTSMAARLNQLENQLRRVQADVQIKDVKIERLQIELQRYETRKDDSSEDAEQDNRVTTLEAKCAALQAQIADMDALLRRNNMVWNDFAVNNNNNNNSNGWVNSSAAPSPIPKASYRRPFPYVMKTVVGAIAELNALAGDGVGSITTASKTHRLKMPSSLPLTLYRNGFLLRQGPFREYDEPGAKAFWRDVLDGYFPGELRPTYPDGVPFELVDRHEDWYIHPNATSYVPFSGRGCIVQSKSDDSLSSRGSSESGDEEEDHENRVFMGPKQVWNPDITLVQKPTTELPAGTTARGTAKICSLTTMNEPREQTRTGFLSRLPKYVIRNGQVVTVREGIAALLDNSPNSSSSSPTPSVSTQPIPVVIHIPHCPRTHPTKDPPATLRITSPDREYVVWARERHLVGDIMAGLETYIGPRDTWELRTAWERGGYPPDKSLQECGLTPNARMYIKYLRP